MSWIMVDIEADGPIPGDYSMVSFGAVVVEPGMERTFYGELRPISEKFDPEALAVSGFTCEQTLAFPEPEGVMRKFTSWIAEVGAGRPMFISDNIRCGDGSLYTGIAKNVGRRQRGAAPTSNKHCGVCVSGVTEPQRCYPRSESRSASRDWMRCAPR